MRNVSTKAATVFHQYIGGTLRGAVKVPPHSCYFNAYSVCPNTKVLIPSEAGVPTYLELHGNLIARRDWHGKVEINLAGYPTPTTSDRLRAVVRKFGLTISKMGGRYYLWRGGLPFPLPDDGWVTVMLPDDHPDRRQLTQPELIPA